MQKAYLFLEHQLLEDKSEINFQVACTDKPTAHTLSWYKTPRKPRKVLSEQVRRKVAEVSGKRRATFSHAYI